MATISRNHAVVDLPRIRFQGFFACMVWLFVHLLGVKHKFFIPLSWTCDAFTYNPSLRLISRRWKKVVPADLVYCQKGPMPILDQFQLEGKTAIVTGASKGIGAAIAHAFAEAGARVVLSSRKQEAVEAVADQIGKNALPIAANAGEPEQLQGLVQRTTEAFGGIDIIVNNAATNPVFGPVEQTEGWAYDKIMAVNVKGPFELCKLALPSMKERGGGAILNISSVGGLTPEHQLGIYSVSKAALISLTKVLAREWGTYGIRANAICPGLIKTKFSEALWSNEKILKHTLAQLPLPRVGTVEEIAGLALFLAAPASSYCTGGVYTADGGYTV